MARARGFSLVELMIVVSIISILSAIAIPAFTELQYKARRAELPPNVDGIKTAQVAYEASHDVFLDCATAPRTLAGDPSDKQLVAWPAPYPTGWLELDWHPDGDVRGAYTTWSIGTSLEPGFCVRGEENVDGDGEIGTFYATATSNVSSADASSCGGSST